MRGEGDFAQLYGRCEGSSLTTSARPPRLFWAYGACLVAGSRWVSRLKSFRKRIQIDVPRRRAELDG